MLRFGPVYWLILAVSLPISASAQTAAPSAFLEQVQNAVLGGKAIHAIKMSGTAEWIAGSQHETGTFSLEAHVDGSSSLQLNLNKASRTEMQAKADSVRTCQRTDAAGTVHPVPGANCFVSIPWFAPVLFAQSASQLPALLTTTDDGQVTKDGATLHQVSYRLNLKGRDDASTKRKQKASTVQVSYDPNTLLPARVDCSVFFDNDDLRFLDVKALFSDYRLESGVMMPHRITKYLQRALQLELTVSNVSVE